MGTTIGHISLWNTPPREAETLLPGGKALVPRNSWTTLLHQDFCLRLDPFKLGRRLSKKQAAPVLSFTLFDSDTLALFLFIGGKQVLCHQISPEYQRLCKPERLMEAFHIDPACRLDLLHCLKDEDAEEQAGLLEAFLGIPLLIDWTWFDEHPDGDTADYPLMSIEAAAGLLKRRHVKNQTRAILLEERPGSAVALSAPSHFLFFPPGRRRGADICRLGPAGMETVISGAGMDFDRDIQLFQLPHGYAVGNHMLPTEDGREPAQRRLHSVEQEPLPDGTVTGPIWRLHQWCGVSTFDRNGAFLRHVVFPEPDIHILAPAADGGWFAESAQPDNPFSGERLLLGYSEDGRRLWSRPYLHGRLLLPHEGYLYTDIPLGGDSGDSPQNRLYKLDGKGRILAAGHKLPPPVLSAGEERLDATACLFQPDGSLQLLIDARHIPEEGAYLCELDAGLHPLHCRKLPGCPYFNRVHEDPGCHRLLLESYAAVTPLDLLSGIPGESLSLRSLACLWVDGRGRLYVQKHGSTLELYTPGFRLLSRHQLKGGIEQAYAAGGEAALVLTSTTDEHAALPLVRLYRIQDISCTQGSR